MGKNYIKNCYNNPIVQQTEEVIMSIVMVSDIVEENGKTVRQNNMKKTHSIPLGYLVEIDGSGGADEYHGVRLWVVKHSRDCDGTPLYDLSFEPNAQNELDELEAEKESSKRDQMLWALWSANHWRTSGKIVRHFSEESLTPIK